MRTLFLIGLAVGAAFMAGWFTIERDGERTRIEINKTEMRNDARQAIDRGRQYIDQRDQERIAGQQDGATEGNNWPPQSAPPWGGVEEAGYAGPSYPQQPGYGQPQPNYGQPQPGFGQSQPGYGYPNAGAPTSNGYPEPGSYSPGYPSDPGQTTPRYSQSPPPWQQQTR